MVNPMAPSPSVRRIRTGVLEIAYEESGPADGAPVILLHGWPYDPRDYDEAAPLLAAAGCRVIVPYLRGFGPTRFLSDATLRSGQQAALGSDLKELMDALGIKRAVLAGYDWGGRAACVVAALWPERARCLVTGNGYNIQDIPHANNPASAEQEVRYWYQYYFHTERGRAGLNTKSPRIDPARLAPVVTALAFRRCALRTLDGIVGQPGFRRRHHPVLPAPLRQCAGRSCL